MVTAGQDHQCVALQSVDEAMFVIDAARPAARKVLAQRFRLADPNEAITQASLDQLVDPSQLLAVLTLPDGTTPEAGWPDGRPDLNPLQQLDLSSADNLDNLYLVSRPGNSN